MLIHSLLTCLNRHVKIGDNKQEEAIMIEFDAGSFSDISGTPTGQGLWQFLNSEETLIRLETTTYLRRPALEGVQRQLLDEFGDEIKKDRWKQMIGRMTRQILESRGYRLDQNGVRTKIKDLFTSASRYTRT